MKLDVVFQSLENDFKVDFKDDNNFNSCLGSYVESETSDHSALYNRDQPNQHPISSITGLQDAINSIPVILCDTTASWNAHIDYIPPKGAIVAYSDYSIIDGVDIPNFKISDGLAYLIDQPFVGDDVREIINEHIRDTTIHITAAEREKWNNKVSCSLIRLDENEYMLAFMTG